MSLTGANTDQLLMNLWISLKPRPIYTLRALP